jgi:D-glycero-D-manno-heptose 1,7-bisphosphate phosphatase
MILKPAIFLDRDGTLIVEREYLADPALVELEHGAAEGLRRLGAGGRPLVVLTNQSGIARGYFDRRAADAVNARVAELLGSEGVSIARWYVCPHGPDDACRCRKPFPGLAEQAASDLGLDLAASWVIGDKRSDVALADAIRGKGLLVTTGHGRHDEPWAVAAEKPVAKNLVEAADIICGTAPFIL